MKHQNYNDNNISHFGNINNNYSYNKQILNQNNNN